MVLDFCERGYPPALVSRHVEEVNKLSFTEARHRGKRSQRSEHIPFVSTFSELSPKIGQAIKKHWHVLRDCFGHISSFQLPPMLSYRRNTSRDKLVKNVPGPVKLRQIFLGTRRLGSYPCCNCIN